LGLIGPDLTQAYWKKGELMLPIGQDCWTILEFVVEGLMDQQGLRQKVN
jgi:hypothetical protein